MNWKFWSKHNSSQPDAAGQRTPKLGGPKNVPQQIGRHLVVHENLDPDYVWNLKCVLRPQGGRSGRSDFRLYSPASAREAALSVKDFGSLDTHPHLVLFQGWFDKATNLVELYPGAPDKAA